MVLLKKTIIGMRITNFIMIYALVRDNKCSGIICPSFVNKSLEVKSSVTSTSTFFKCFRYLSMRKLKTN